MRKEIKSILDKYNNQTVSGRLIKSSYADKALYDGYFRYTFNTDDLPEDAVELKMSIIPYKGYTRSKDKKFLVHRLSLGWTKYDETMKEWIPFNQFDNIHRPLDICKLEPTISVCELYYPFASTEKIQEFTLKSEDYIRMTIGVCNVLSGLNCHKLDLSEHKFAIDIMNESDEALQFDYVLLSQSAFNMEKEIRRVKILTHEDDISKIEIYGWLNQFVELFDTKTVLMSDKIQLDLSMRIALKVFADEGVEVIRCNMTDAVIESKLAKLALFGNKTNKVICIV
jgi:hypothetical protein